MACLAAELGRAPPSKIIKSSTPRIPPALSKLENSFSGHQSSTAVVLGSQAKMDLKSKGCTLEPPAPLFSLMPKVQPEEQETTQEAMAPYLSPYPGRQSVPEIALDYVPIEKNCNGYLFGRGLLPKPGFNVRCSPCHVRAALALFLATTPEGLYINELIQSTASATDGLGGLYGFYEPGSGEVKLGHSNCPRRRRREWRRQCAPQTQIWWPFYWEVPHRKKFEKIMHSFLKAIGAWTGKHRCSYCHKVHQEKFCLEKCGGAYTLTLTIDVFVLALGWAIRHRITPRFCTPCPRDYPACEDYPRKMAVEINGTRPLDFMTPKFLMLASHHSAKMRSHAIACPSYFVPVGSQSLFVHIDNFIATLFKLASDDDPSVRRHVCQALVLLFAARPEKLMPEMANVAEYMLYSTKDKNENVALEACEFWLTFAEDADLAMHLHPLLGKVAPVSVDYLLDARPLCELDDAADLGGAQELILVPTMEGLLRMVLDNSKRVQEAGCSAFATLEEDAGLELIPARAAEPRRCDDGEDLIPLLEQPSDDNPAAQCLASVTIAIGVSFLPYAPPVFERSSRLEHPGTPRFPSALLPHCRSQRAKESAKATHRHSTTKRRRQSPIATFVPPHPQQFAFSLRCPTKPPSVPLPHIGFDRFSGDTQKTGPYAFSADFGSSSSSAADRFRFGGEGGSPTSYGSARGYGGYGGGYDEYADSSAHSGSVSGGSRPASSSGGGDYGPPYLNGRHDMHHHADLRHPDLHHGELHPDLHHASDLHRPPEFSSAFGLMSLDDPNVLAGLATDGVPFFSHTAPHEARRGSMQLAPPPQPLAYQAYSPPSSSHSHSGASGNHNAGGNSIPTPGREAETRELREFWKAYMRTPLTGPPGGGDALGLQTPSANPGPNQGMLGVGATPTRESVAGNGRRFRVASLPSVKTPEGEMDAAPVYPVYDRHAHQGHQQLAPPPMAQGRTMHHADDLRSYEAAVLARKAPELVLRKPVRRPTTSAGVTGPTQQPQQQHASQHQQQQPAMFEFGAAARERGGGAGAGDSSSLAGAFGFGQGYAAAPSSTSPSNTSNTNNTNSGPNSPFPGTPTSAASASASASASDDEGAEALRPAFKRLPSQTLGPLQTKRRRDRTAEGGVVGMAPLTLAPPPPESGNQQRERESSVNAYPDRPMIALRAPPLGAHPQRRVRRLSAPASPTGAAFVIN
ncbi:hypothetical protein C8R47DRAFT_1252659 [Mycena vitilis]|nr:hypothetical protein C8R47DRAFT_1252659 [Mycena vitilis]